MEAGQKWIKLQSSGKLVYLVIQSILPYFAFCEKIKNPDSGNQEVLSKILCKWKQDSVVSLFLYLDSVFKYKHKLVHNQSPV